MFFKGIVVGSRKDKAIIEKLSDFASN